jgi:ferredoxin
VAGAPFAICRRLLGENGLELAAGWSVKMPSNYIPLYNPPGGDKAARILERAAPKIDRIIDALQAGTTGVYEDTKAPLRWIAPLVYDQSAKSFAEKDRHFRVEETCIHCGRCERICPVDNIRLEDGRPTWQHHCEQCMACIAWCPAKAIQYDTRSKGRNRYRHPDVEADELCLRGVCDKD